MSLSLSLTNKIERKIRKATVFQYITSNKSEQVIEALRQISVRSGMTIYIWYSKLGLVNIKSKQMPLPGTRSVLEALKYASKNHYFAVYVFPAVNNADLMEIKGTLPSANTNLKVNEHTRHLFIFNEDVFFPYLRTNGEQIELSNEHTKKYKLRDSKWVLSDE